MSTRYRYTTMDRVFSKLDRDVTSDFNEDDVVEWTGEALEFIGSVKSYEEAVCFLNVVNHQVAMPKWLHAIIQIARDNSVTSPTTGTVYSQTTTSDIDGEIVDIKYNVWVSSEAYQRFTPVRLKDHSFFDSIVCQNNDPIYNDCVDEYTVKQGNILRFSFKEGLVAIAYLKQATDENGWPMVPDTVSHLTAITKYIALRIASRDFSNGREGAEKRLSKAEQDWDWYCSQAGNIDMMPHGIDEHQNLLDQRSYLLPRNNRYFGFFGNLATPEVRNYLNPNRRQRYH